MSEASTLLNKKTSLFSKEEQQKRLAVRLKNSRNALRLTQEEAMAQISRNGSIKSPNPFYVGPVNTAG